MKVNGIFTALKTTLSGLSVQLRRLELISENIANVEKSPDQNGQVYRKKVLISQNQKSVPTRSFGEQLNLKMRRSQNAHLTSVASNEPPVAEKTNELFPYKVKELKGEKLVYNPAHPQADSNGYVRMPDINPVEEMVDLISASRTYEANVTVMNAAKNIAKQALEI